MGGIFAPFFEDEYTELVEAVCIAKKICKREIKAVTLQPIKPTGCSTVGSAPRSGRGGRKFESSHPDLKDWEPA